MSEQPASYRKTLDLRQCRTPVGREAALLAACAEAEPTCGPDEHVAWYSDEPGIVVVEVRKKPAGRVDPHGCVEQPVVLTAAAARRTADAVLTVLYRNHKGEVAVRRILPSGIWFGETQWHPTPQWFVRALDMVKEQWRDFALIDFLAIGAKSVAAYQRREVDVAKVRGVIDTLQRMVPSE